jgi:trimethylamine:corrinoid methyltransferase-like protein
MIGILNEADVGVLSDAVCEVLEKQGFNCESRTILEAYESGGALVDYEAQVAKFPREVMQGFAEALRNEDKSGWRDQLEVEDRDVIYSGFHPYNAGSEFIAPKPPYMFHNLSTYYYDDDTGERRLGNHTDFIKLIQLGDMLHPEQGMGHALNLVADTPTAIEPLEAALVLLEHSHNPRGVYVMDVRQIPYLEEIEAIFGIEDPRWHWMANICPISPLKLDRLAGERYVHMLQTGLYPAKLAAMPVSGVNMPITTGGTIVVIAAEFMALWFAARALQPKKIPLTGMPILGTMDLSNGNVSFTAFDAAIRRLSICDFVRQWTGVQLAPGPGEWTPTKKPSMYCTLEKAYFAMIAASFTGYHPEIGVGHIDSGLTISPVQLLLDHEFTQGLQFLEKPVIKREELGLDGIFDVGFGYNENFLMTENTLEHMRSATWMPNSFSRDAWTPEADAAALARAAARVRELVSEYRKPEGREDQVAAARAVVERAKREM